MPGEVKYLTPVGQSAQIITVLLYRVRANYLRFGRHSWRRIVSIRTHRVTWGKAPPFGDDLSLTYLFASTSEKSYMYVTNYMLCV